MSVLENTQNNREQIITCVRRWGGLASDAALDPNCRYFSLPEIEGLIAYREEFGCAIALGDPICPQPESLKLAKAFHDFHDAQNKRVIYLAVSQAFAKWAVHNICGIAIEFGEEVMIDPHQDPKAYTGTHACLVRRKVKHAIKDNVTTAEYREHNLNLEEAMKQVGQAWLQKRSGPQIHISRVCLFADRLGKRWFYASQGERVIGVLLMNELQAHQGWLINRLMVYPDAPHGTSELLVTSTLEALASEGCHFVTFGVVPKTSLGEIIGLGTYGTWISRCIYACAKKVFYIGGTKIFWEKFHPENAPSYLLFNKNTFGMRDLVGLARAMNASL